MLYEIFPFDCVAAMNMCMAENSVDSIVTDPPYDLTSVVRRFGSEDAAPCTPQNGAAGVYARSSAGFMGKTWDGTGVAFDPATWRAALRVLKPGGYLLAFGGTRTYHRMACAIEDAGFEVRDMISWLYGSGFPKSNNDGNGRGSALKPSCEPIVMARKPFKGTIDNNVARWGTGRIEIDGCRIESDEAPAGRSRHGGGLMQGSSFQMPDSRSEMAAGRWPANTIHDGSDEVIEAFPPAPGQLARASTNPDSPMTRGIYGPRKRVGEASQERRYTDDGSTNFAALPGDRRTDSGSAARFFYCAKTSKTDREEGLSHLSAVDQVNGNKWTDVDYRVLNGERPPSAQSGPRRNTHPTVKPNDLMRYLVRLVTPAGGLVLDPFTGSGSTGKAAIQEGMRFVGCEMTPEYLPILHGRIDHAVRTTYGASQGSMTNA